MERDPGAFVGERYLRAGHNRSASIGDRPDDAGGRALAKESQWRQNQQGKELRNRCTHR